MIDGERRGPFSLDELPKAGITPETYVWCKEMADWEQAADVADICRYYRQRLSGTLPTPQIKAEKSDTLNGFSSVDNLSEEKRKALDELPPIFRKIVENHGVTPGERIPTDEEMEVEPRSPLAVAILLTLLCFPPTGFISIYYCYRMKKEWRQSCEASSQEERKQLIARAYESQRQSRLWLGITFFFGMILASIAVNFA